MRADYQLPSKKTSKVSNLNEKRFLTNIFQSIEEKQKLCLLLYDEVYVEKKSCNTMVAHYSEKQWMT